MSFSAHLSFAQRQVQSVAGKLMYDTRMLAPGARIGVAVSGGEDSLTLLAILDRKRRVLPFAVELMLLHVNPGFDPDNHAPLAVLAKDMGISAHIEVSDFGPRAHSPENRKRSPCFWCSWNRRKRLFELCARFRLDRLAMGHNALDLATSFALNLLQTGRVEGMSARESFFGGKLLLIRPLLFVDKKVISRAARDFGLPVFANPCPSSGQSKRAEMALRLDLFTGKDKRRAASMGNALRRFQLDSDLAKL